MGAPQPDSAKNLKNFVLHLNASQKNKRLQSLSGELFT